MSKKIDCVCAWCGEHFKRYAYQIRGENQFCCFDHFRYFASKRMHEMNLELNPSRMTEATRSKLRDAHMNTGEGRTYSKEYGRHTHRVEMERILGRPLNPGEVVHHIDGDKRNNSPDNLMVFPNQSEHAKYHAWLNRFFGEGGDRI